MPTSGLTLTETPSYGGLLQNLRRISYTVSLGHVYFLPADMVSQILNFGLPAPIDIQIVGNDLEAIASAQTC